MYNKKLKEYSKTAAPPRKRSYKVPYEVNKFTPPRVNSPISSKDTAPKSKEPRKGLYLFG